MPTIRRYDGRDHDAVMDLADRLTDGQRPWRDRDAWLAVVRGWVAESLAAADAPAHAVLVADHDGDVVGFVALETRTHPTGAVDAYVGQIAVAADHTRHGIGRLLLQAGEAWAREHGFTQLTLDTGGANAAARALYASTGFVEEDVRLTKVLGDPRR